MELVIFVVLMFCFLLYGGYVSYKSKKHMGLVKDIISGNGPIINLEGRSTDLEKVFYIKKHKINNYQYNEEKIHVGAVSVGGVTTGGVYKTGGDYSIKKGNTDRYELIYKYMDEKYVLREVCINRINLSEHLANEAMKSEIAPYVNNRTINVIEKVPPSEYLMMLYKMGKNDAAMNQSELEDSEGYPTKEKIDAIYNWICKKI